MVRGITKTRTQLSDFPSLGRGNWGSERPGCLPEVTPLISTELGSNPGSFGSRSGFFHCIKHLPSLAWRGGKVRSWSILKLMRFRNQGGDMTLVCAGYSLSFTYCPRP